LIGVTVLADKAAKAGYSLFGEAITRDTPVSLEAACIVGSVIVIFSVWINRKFEASASAAKDAAKSATDAHVAAEAAHHAVVEDSKESQKLADNIELIKKQLGELPCSRPSSRIACKTLTVDQP
jgi:hypothetical protein